MTYHRLGFFLVMSCYLLSAQPKIINLETAQWTKDKDSESVLLHMNETTGAMDILVRFPAGHIIAPHSHDSNERIMVAEGQLTLQQDGKATTIAPGGYAFLPAHDVQRISCSSKTRCTFYLSWDGSPRSHPAK